MRCFVHREAEAVGTCRSCNKGLCGSCASDLGHSISCRGDCERKANTLNSQVAQSAVVLSTQKRNRYFLPAFFMVMGVGFLLFESDGGWELNLGTAMGAGFVFFGIILAALGHRYARELDEKA